MTLQSDALELDINVEDTLQIQWKDRKSQEVLLSDCKTRSYCYQFSSTPSVHHDGALWHYTQAIEEDCYYGFGEKAGPLNKHGMVGSPPPLQKPYQSYATP